MDFFPDTISTAALHSDQVPSPLGPLEGFRGDEPPAIWRFARSYRPPADLPNPQELSSFVTEAAVKHWVDHGELPEIGLGGLRLTLWWLFQQWRHTQSAGDWESTYPEYASYVRATVTKIHLELYQEESWWWDPAHTPSDEEREQRALWRANETHGVAELYRLAAEILDLVIARRDSGEEDPLGLPLIQLDAGQAALVYAAYDLAKGLVASAGGRSFEDAQATAYERASLS